MPREQMAVAPAHIACVGLGWFPKTPGGLDRYVYELTYHLAAAQDRADCRQYAADNFDSNQNRPYWASSATSVTIQKLKIRRLCKCQD